MAGRPVTLYAGSSGFSYKAWKGHFYPDDIRDQEMLAFYSRQLGAVEINNTFYRLPRRNVLQHWADVTPEDFRFVIKASRRITHFKHLKDAEEPVGYLLENLSVLERRLGCILFQLPPALRCDLEVLKRFLELLSPGLPVSFEFRNPSWFEDGVLDCLSARNIAVCHSDDDGSQFPWVHTADWSYLRLRRPSYDDDDLRGWRRKLAEVNGAAAYVFFKHEDEAAAPRLARRLLDLVP
jgi:uncharacterized protein YecE (DUF72 family)